MRRKPNNRWITSCSASRGVAGSTSTARQTGGCDPWWPGAPRLAAVASGTLLAAGSLLTCFGVFDAGMASARDPKFNVVPQRERMAAREASVHSATRWAPISVCAVCIVRPDVPRRRNLIV
jgi:hypothetical protein